MESLQKKFEVEVQKFQNLQKELNKHITQRQTLESQFTENQFVKEEFDVLKPDDVIYKLIGPILVKQELSEAKQNVDKRIDYIQAELKRHDVAIKDNETKQDDMKDAIMKIQQQLQQAKVKAAAKA